MFKKIIMFFVGVIFFSSYRFVFANPVINEIMYDLEGADTGREWVEIYNNSDTAVDLSTFKFFEADTNHGLTVSEGDANIGAQGYAVIISDNVKFKTDWPNFSGTIFDSSFSLSNEGEALALKDGNLNIVDEYTYTSGTGAMGDGNSLQKILGSWMGATPTPGATNETTTPPPPASDSSTSSSSSSSSGGGGSSSGSSSSATETKTKVTEEPKIKTKITAKTLVFTKIPVEFKAKATGYSNELLSYGKYFWNFGDGDSKEERVNNVEKLTHTYFYPGDYVVTLEYYVNYYGNIPDASDKITIKVVPVDILISGVGDEKDFFVELLNNTNYEADISKWILAGNNHRFVFPKNTILGSKKKISFSSKITNFSIEDKNALKLLSPQGELIFDYPLTLARTVLAKTTTSPNPLLVKERAQGEVNSDVALTSITSASENLPASVVQSDVIKNDSGNMYTIIISLISFIFIGASASAVYFLRQKKTISKTGDDFEILGE